MPLKDLKKSELLYKQKNSTIDRFVQFKQNNLLPSLTTNETNLINKNTFSSSFKKGKRKILNDNTRTYLSPIRTKESA